MKKLFVPLFLIILFLTGCNETTANLREVEGITDDLQNHVDPDLTLQAITVYEKGYYIVFHSSGEVESELETKDDTLLIKLTETSSQADSLKQHTLYLSTAPEYDTIEVHVNGNPTPFDNIFVQ